jgi:hypothetical protein
MKKVYQTIVAKDTGNCIQAAIASLFEKELDEVPDFKSYGTKWYLEYQRFFKKMGYGIPIEFHANRHSLKFMKKILKHDNGVDGFFEATVKSQTFENTFHSVIVDTNLKVVHDPNPNQLALKLKPTDIISVATVKDNWHVSDGKLIITS